MHERATHRFLLVGVACSCLLPVVSWVCHLSLLGMSWKGRVCPLLRRSSNVFLLSPELKSCLRSLWQMDVSVPLIHKAGELKDKDILAIWPGPQVIGGWSLSESTLYRSTRKSRARKAGLSTSQAVYRILDNRRTCMFAVNLHVVRDAPSFRRRSDKRLTDWDARMERGSLALWLVLEAQLGC